MDGANITFLTKQTYDDFIRNHDGLVLVTDKLNPSCEIMENALMNISKQFPISIAFIDYKAEPELIRVSGVDHVPSLLIAQNGKIRFRFAGIMDPNEVLSVYGNDYSL